MFRKWLNIHEDEVGVFFWSAFLLFLIHFNEHLTQERKTRVENILRVLSIQDATGQMRIIWRGLSSSDSRRRSNSVEALSDLLDKALGKILVPLLEEMPSEDCLRIGRKYFSLPDYGGSPAILVSRLLMGTNWVTTLLSLSLAVRRDWLVSRLMFWLRKRYRVRLEN